MRLISSLLQKFWFSSVTIFFFFSFSLDPGWLAVLGKMEMPKWNPLWSHKDGLLCTFPTFLAFTADSDQVPRLYQKAWIVSIIILLLYDDGAKAVLLRWKEWWVALFIEKNGGWHFAVTSVSLDPRIHDRFTADAVKFTISVFWHYRCCCMYNHDQRLHSPFFCADIRVKSESNPICPSQIWVIKGSSSARQFYSTN